MPEMITISPQGTVNRIPLTKFPALEQLQKAVDGYIELVPYFNKFEGNPCLAFCNEYGKLKHFPLNQIATNLWMEAFGQSVVPDYLVGTIVIVSGPKEFLKDEEEEDE
jgi:hypothetical protein